VTDAYHGPTEKLGRRVSGDANHPRATTAHCQPTPPPQSEARLDNQQPLGQAGKLRRRDHLPSCSLPPKALRFKLLCLHDQGQENLHSLLGDRQIAPRRDDETLVGDRRQARAVNGNRCIVTEAGVRRP
jgi:hypothetical protein